MNTLFTLVLQITFHLFFAKDIIIRRFITITFCLLFSFFSLNAQIFFSTNGGHKTIGEVDIDNCDFEFTRHSETFNDITLHPNGKLYGIIRVGFSRALVELDVEKEIFVDTLVLIGGFGATSLTCSKEGLFYLGHVQIYSYNMDTDSLSNLGALPDNQALAGDLVFYNGKLLGGTYNVFQDSPFTYLYECDIDSLYNSKRVFQFLDYQSAGGLAVLYEASNDASILIGSSFNRPDLGRDTSYLHQIDLIDSTMSEICRIDLSQQVIFGLASADELRTNFHLQLDLDTDNSSGRYIDHYENDTRCTYEYPIADEDVSIISTHELIDSMVIEVEGGILHEGEELLTGEVNNSLFTLIGNQSTHLAYHNLGSASPDDFIAALETVRFSIGVNNPLAGEREVRVYLYANGEVSDGSRAFLVVSFKPPVAGEDGYIALCTGYNSSNIPMAAHLFLHLEGEPDEGGTWHPEPSFGDGVVNIYEDASGIYQYIVQEGVCPADTAIVEYNRLPDPDVTLGETEFEVIYLCEGDSITWDISIPNPDEYIWEDGSTNPIRVVREEGYYAANIRDSIGCNTTVEVQILLLPDSNRHSMENQLLCEGESYNWQGQVIRSDTVLCEQYALASGCDSTHCIDLRFASSYDITENISLCRPDTFWWEEQVILQDTLICMDYTTIEGCDSLVCYELHFFEDFSSTESYTFVCGQETYEVEGVTFEQDTSFCLNYETVGGCDSMRCIVAEIVPIPITMLELELCIGDTIDIGDERLTAGGIYDISLETEVGCDSSLQVVVNVLISYQQTIDTSLLEGEQITIGDETFAETGEYEINLETTENCDSTIFLNLTIVSSTINLNEIPSAYQATSLIHLEQGEVFRLFSLTNEPTEIQSIHLFDMWGRTIYDQKDIHQDIAFFEWRPATATPLIVAGLYWYQIELEDEFGETIHFVGKLVML